MSVFDGSDEELTYGQALVEVVQRISWNTEAQANAALRAVQKEFGLLPPEIPIEQQYGDSRDVTIHNQDAELARLRKELEAEKLRGELARQRAANNGDTEKVREPEVPAAPAVVADPFPLSGTAGKVSDQAPDYTGQ